MHPGPAEKNDNYLHQTALLGRALHHMLSSTTVVWEERRLAVERLPARWNWQVVFTQLDFFLLEMSNSWGDISGIKSSAVHVVPVESRRQTVWGSGATTKHFFYHIPVYSAALLCQADTSLDQTNSSRVF